MELEASASGFTLVLTLYCPSLSAMTCQQRVSSLRRHCINSWPKLSGLKDGVSLAYLALKWPIDGRIESTLCKEEVDLSQLPLFNVIEDKLVICNHLEICITFVIHRVCSLIPIQPMWFFSELKVPCFKAGSLDQVYKLFVSHINDWTYDCVRL